MQPEQGWRTEQQMSVISGLAARYPMQKGAQPVSGTRHFWDGLCAGANLSTVVPLTRWDIDDVYSPDMAAKKMYVASLWRICLLAGHQLRPC